jgi:hypothetical protein
LVAHGLHGLQAAFFTAHGLHGLQAAFFTAHGLHGLHAFFGWHWAIWTLPGRSGPAAAAGSATAAPRPHMVAIPIAVAVFFIIWSTLHSVRSGRQWAAPLRSLRALRTGEWVSKRINFC